MPGKKLVRLPTRRRRPGVTGYRGVVELGLVRWYACISKDGRKYTLGTFDSPHHAAVAINFVTELLFPGVPATYLNAVPAEHLPGPDLAATIRQEVNCRLARYGLVPAPT
ncbi:MAG: AP2/ERF family transcription factor [Gemmataceae bacterium]